MDRKEFKFKVKSVEDSGEFTGYASIFGNVDLVGDIVEPGAFAKTLADKGGRVKLLDGHDRDKRAGIVFLKEDARGLYVDRGVLNLKSPVGRQLYEDLKFYSEHDEPMGMSIGYDVLAAEPEGRINHLKELKLWEVSIVTFPANERAGVTSVKALEEQLQALKDLQAEDTKAGRVLSARNESLVQNAIEALKALIEAANASRGAGDDDEPSDDGEPSKNASDAAATGDAAPAEGHAANEAEQAALADLFSKLKTLNTPLN